MVEANIYIDYARQEDVLDVAHDVIAMQGLSAKAPIRQVKEKAGGVELIVIYENYIDYEELVYELELAFERVSTFEY
jgi:hypothetical protein